MRPPHPFRPLFSVAATLLLGACARTTPPEFDATAESAKLLQRDAEWADAATAGKDVEKIISYWTDDAVVIEPGQPAVEGKQAIRAFVTASVKAPGFNIRWVSEKPIFSPSGGMAYMRAATEMTVPVAKGAPMTLHLQGYSIWRKDADGVWRCAVDIATEAPTTRALPRA